MYLNTLLWNCVTPLYMRYIYMYILQVGTYLLVVTSDVFHCLVHWKAWCSWKKGILQVYFEASYERTCSSSSIGHWFVHFSVFFFTIRSYNYCCNSSTDAICFYKWSPNDWPTSTHKLNNGFLCLVYAYLIKLQVIPCLEWIATGQMRSEGDITAANLISGYLLLRQKVMS